MHLSQPIFDCLTLSLYIMSVVSSIRSPLFSDTKPDSPKHCEIDRYMPLQAHTRLSDESSLLITDIIVELEDGTLANIEVQKIGYVFPGARCACYSSDMLLRQYKRVRQRSIDPKYPSIPDFPWIFCRIIFLYVLTFSVQKCTIKR